MPLPFAPAGLPILLGSLPHTDAHEAVAATRQHAGTLLVWPQLPQRSFREHSVVQSARGFPGLVVDEANKRVYVDRARAEQELDRLALAYLENSTHYARLPASDAAGLAEVLDHEYERSGARMLGGHVLGPISLAMQLTDENQQPLINDSMLFDAIVQHVRLRATWQEARLGELTGATLICLEEPFLEMVGQPFLPLDWDEARARLDEVFSGLNGGRALYAGGAIDWSAVISTAAELVIGDVYNHGEQLIRAAEPLKAWLHEGGMIGLGLVPADAALLAEVSAERLIEHLDQLLAQLAAHDIEPHVVIEQSVITSNAGLGMLDVAAAEQALRLQAEVSSRLRERSTPA
jgi:hypothetical protein